MQNLILTLASKYNKAQLAPFFDSLYSTAFEGQCVVFGTLLNEKTINYIKSKGAIFIHYTESYPYLEDANYVIDNPGQYLSPNSLRYFLYQAYLKKHPINYRYIMHTDIRDVYFQCDPFADFETNGINFYLENKKTLIKDCPFNSYWIKHGFGESIYKEISNKRISCSGVTFGTYNAWMEYLKLMNNHLKNIPNTGGMDQGIHNYILNYNHNQLFFPIEDDFLNVSTVSSNKPVEFIYFDSKNRVTDINKRLIPVIHQYDRHWKMLWVWNRKLYFSKKWDYIKQFLFAVKNKNKLQWKFIKNLKSILFDAKVGNYDWS